MSVLKPYERWRQIESLKNMQLRKNYACTDFGRIISYDEDINSGRVVAKATVEGYHVLSLKPFGGKANRTLLVHKLVAEIFLEKPSEAHIFIIHLDRNKRNNFPKNLKWVTKEEWWAHWKKSPQVQESIKKNLISPKHEGMKLTSTDVIRIKRMINDPKRKNTMKRIAKMFGISEMQVYRIKRGENWKHVTV